MANAVEVVRSSLRRISLCVILAMSRHAGVQHHVVVAFVVLLRSGFDLPGLAAGCRGYFVRPVFA